MHLCSAMIAVMRLARSNITVFKLRYPRPVRWKDTVEDGATFVLLRLFSDGGLEGIAEGPIKPTWTGTTRRALVAVIEDMLLPALETTDLSDPAAVRARLNAFPENTLAKALIDNACWDLRSQARGVALWRLWGGNREVPLSWTVTRAAPALMANEAADMIERYGFRTLKVKGGQGFDIDQLALGEIRAAVGPSIRLYVDANAACSKEQAPAYIGMLAEAGATHAEDPCELRPGVWFADTQENSPIPLVVDSGAQSLADAQLFLERGARALGVKSTRVGASVSLDIARAADAAGARVNIGLHAESALGSIIATHVAAAFPRHADSLPAESSFFLAYCESITHELPQIREGVMTLSDHPGFAAMIDWDKLGRYAV
jgi:L-alanine-DL-glutamate epimerase-like enolase superfamily enzyme